MLSGGGTDAENSVSTQAAAANTLTDGATIDAEGSYVLNAGTYAQGIKVNAEGKKVEIEITGDINVESGRLLDVENVGELIITNNGHTVEATTDQAKDFVYVANGTVTVNGGTYKNEKSDFGLENTLKMAVLYFVSGTGYLNGVTVVTSGRAVEITEADVTFEGGSYTTDAPNFSTLHNAKGKMNLNSVTVVTEKGNPVGNYGEATITGGTYISKSNSMAINAGIKSTTYIHGGTYEGTGTVINNRGHMEIDQGALICVSPNQPEPKTRAGVRTEDGNNANGLGGVTLIKDATIENADYGVWNKSTGSQVTVDNVTFKENKEEIHLEDGQTVALGENLTGTVTIGWDDTLGDTPNIITSGTTVPDGVKLVSAKEGSVIVPEEVDGKTVVSVKARTGYLVDTENATATADLNDGNVVQTLAYYTQVPKDTTVTLTAAAAPAGQQFDHWELMKGNEDKTAELLSTLTEEERKETTVTFAMPDYDLLAKAVYEDIPTPEPEPIPEPEPEQPADDAGTGVAIVLGGAALGATAYVVGTQLWLETHLPDGVIPTSRQQLAELLWNAAGKPQPASTALYADISAEAADSQLAARWCVEQGLMADYGETFKPSAYVFRPQVIKAWNDVQSMK